MSNKKVQDQYDNITVTQTATQGELVEFAKKRWNKMAYNDSREEFESRCSNVYWLRDTYEHGLTYLDSFKRDVRFPTLNTTITDALDDLVDVLPQTDYVAIDEDLEDNRRRAELVTKARDDFAEKGNKKYEVYETLRHAYTEGVGILYVGRARTLDAGGKVMFDGIDYEAINPLNLYFDENATVLHDPKCKKGCRDVYNHHRMSLSTWYANIENSDKFYNKTSVKPQSEGITDRYTKRQEEEGAQGKVQVDILEYWNREIEWVKGGKKMYGIHAVFSLQGATMVEHFVEECSTIPFAAYYGEKRDDSIYGIPMAEKLAHIIIALDQQMTIAFREAMLTLMPPGIVRADAGYNRRKHTLRSGGMWQLKIPDGQPINNAIQFLQRPQLPSDFYNMRGIFEEELTKVSKQDPRDMLRKPGQLATQIKQQIQSEAKKINSIVKLNTWNAARQVAQLELEVIDRYLKYPMKIDDKRKRNRIITVKGFDVVNDKVPELVRNNGKRRGQFQLTKNLLDTDLDVMVVDRVTNRQMEGDREGRLLQFLQLRTNILAIPPEMQDKINPLLKAIGEVMGLKEDEIDPEDDILITSPRDEQLEFIALGGKPEIEEDMPKKDLMKLRLSWLDFKETSLYEDLSPKIKKGIEEVIRKIEKQLLKPEKKALPPGMPPSEETPQSPMVQGASPQLQSPTALAGGNMQSANLPTNV